MAEDRSLDEFVGTEEASDPEPGESMDAVAEPQDGDGSDPEVEPMAETFAWSASGGRCATCGESVEARWRDGDALVCGDCKAW